MKMPWLHKGRVRVCFELDIVLRQINIFGSSALVMEEPE